MLKLPTRKNKRATARRFFARGM